MIQEHIDVTVTLQLAHLFSTSKPKRDLKIKICVHEFYFTFKGINDYKVENQSRVFQTKNYCPNKEFQKKKEKKRTWYMKRCLYRLHHYKEDKN